MDKLNKMSNSNINKHHQNIIDHTFVVCENIIMELYFSKVHIVWHCEHISLVEMFFRTYSSLLYIQNDILYRNRPFFLENLETINVLLRRI